jgi:hypothetical protein
MSLQLYASAALSGLPPLSGGSMLAVIAATESSSRVVLRLRHQVVKDHLAHHPPPPVEHPRAHNHRPRRVQLAAFSRISSSAVPPSEHDHEVDRLMRCEHRGARLLALGLPISPLSRVTKRSPLRPTTSRSRTSFLASTNSDSKLKRCCISIA